MNSKNSPKTQTSETETVTDKITPNLPPEHLAFLQQYEADRKMELETQKERLEKLLESAKKAREELNKIDQIITSQTRDKAQLLEQLPQLKVVLIELHDLWINDSSTEIYQKHRDLDRELEIFNYAKDKYSLEEYEDFVEQALQNDQVVNRILEAAREFHISTLFHLNRIETELQTELNSLKGEMVKIPEINLPQAPESAEATPRKVLEQAIYKMLVPELIEKNNVFLNDITATGEYKKKLETEYPQKEALLRNVYGPLIARQIVDRIEEDFKQTCPGGYEQEMQGLSQRIGNLKFSEYFYNTDNQFLFNGSIKLEATWENIYFLSVKSRDNSVEMKHDGYRHDEMLLLKELMRGKTLLSAIYSNRSFGRGIFYRNFLLLDYINKYIQKVQESITARSKSFPMNLRIVKIEEVLKEAAKEDPQFIATLQSIVNPSLIEEDGNNQGAGYFALEMTTLLSKALPRTTADGVRIGVNEVKNEEIVKSYQQMCAEIRQLKEQNHIHIPLLLTVQDAQEVIEDIRNRAMAEIMNAQSETHRVRQELEGQLENAHSKQETTELDKQTAELRVKELLARRKESNASLHRYLTAIINEKQEEQKELEPKMMNRGWTKKKQAQAARDRYAALDHEISVLKGMLPRLEEE